MECYVVKLCILFIVKYFVFVKYSQKENLIDLIKQNRGLKLSILQDYMSCNELCDNIVDVVHCAENQLKEDLCHEFA